MSSRDRILTRIRERQARPAVRHAAELESVRAHISAHARSPAPRDDGDPAERFRARALSLASTLDETNARDEVPHRVAAYLREHSLPMRAVCWRELGDLEWRASGIEIDVRSAVDGDLVGITGAYCAIAETGTLMTLSGAATPPSVSLLPETHIAVIRRDRIVPSMEDAWALLRQEHGGLPRAVNFISGPSRTADIEQTVTLGAHGPYRVHIILLGS